MPSLPFEIYDLYKKGSGSKLNRENQKVYGLVVGVVVQILLFIWTGRPHITAVDNILSSWRSRSFSYRGKSLVINALALSCIWYVASLVFKPPRIMHELVS